MEEKQRDVIHAIAKLDGSFCYDYQADANWSILPNAEAPGPAWIRSLLGEDFFAEVVRVRLRGGEVTDTTLEQLDDLNQLQDLDLGGPQITDAALEHLRGMKQLRSLNLAGTQVTCPGLRQIKGLNQLQEVKRLLQPNHGH